MATRHLIRTIIIQSFYEWDFYNRATDLTKIIERNLKDLGQDIDEPDFVWRIAKGIVEHLPEIDKVLEKAAPEWPLSQIALVDRNVLRLGLYELMYADPAEVPPKVAINEAIEIAKNYGGENSPKFINGVLGTVYRQLHPGDDKEQGTKNKEPKNDNEKS